MQERIAVFPGTFDPMTIGHLDLLRRAAALFDRVVVAVGVNTGKQALFPLDERLARIRRATAGMANVEVETYEGTTVDFCLAHCARYIVRGIRNIADFEYERNIADINRLLCPDIETVFLTADPRLAVVSSSMVRELLAFGKDASPYIV